MESHNGIVIYPAIRRTLAVSLAIGIFVPGALRGAPVIRVTNSPPYGAYGDLSGLVSGVEPSAHRVATFIYVSGKWYSKPSCDQQLTPIAADGSWSANITPVASDLNATIIAALLVSSNYSQPCVNGVTGLPNAVFQQGLANVYLSRFNPAARQISFSGYDWWVKTSSGLAGPGPNYFSDSAENVWVDSAGKLHMRITYRGGRWYCAEIISARTFGYGQYRTTIESSVDDLDPGVIVGLFTWSNDAAYNNREIDVELTRWNNAADTNNAQFVVQPATTPQLHRFRVPAGITNSTYSFTWQPGRADFQALRGEFSAAPATGDILRSWSCQLGVPPAGGENMRFNLWLNKGNPPTDGQQVEIVISRFEFVPLGQPQAAQIRSLHRLQGKTWLDILGQSDRRYEVFSSSNLLDWVLLDTVLATNNAFTFVDEQAGNEMGAFYRTTTQP